MTPPPKKKKKPLYIWTPFPDILDPPLMNIHVSQANLVRLYTHIKPQVIQTAGYWSENVKILSFMDMVAILVM